MSELGEDPDRLNKKNNRNYNKQGSLAFLWM